MNEEGDGAKKMVEMLGLNKEAIKHFKILKLKNKTKNAQKQNRYRWTTRRTFIEIREQDVHGIQV